MFDIYLATQQQLKWLRGKACFSFVKVKDGWYLVRVDEFFSSEFRDLAEQNAINVGDILDQSEVAPQALVNQLVDDGVLNTDTPRQALKKVFNRVPAHWMLRAKGR